ncbi:MAG: outer membrane protein transport protein [Flavobacteriaceae bacterium]|nr:outer membrane protein transport protein [Flavobacteriaceae bacterium]
MKTRILSFLFSLTASFLFAQSGHIMQGVGAVNMSMGGAATGHSLDISSAIQWNPAALTSFDGTHIKLDAGLFFSSPELYSTVPIMNPDGTPTGNFMSGLTEDDRDASIMPSLAIAWGKKESKHRFAFSAFGISGFGVTFPESTTNPINTPQNMGGFGHIESDYMLLQMGLSWAYAFTDNFSIGITPNLNYASLELAPNPTANPNAAGYPTTDKATAIGYGAQIGLHYKSDSGMRIGLSYKTPQKFGDFEFENTHLDGSKSENSFNMDYPAIYSIGLGYSNTAFDLAVDYRLVDYKNTNGFSETGWTNTASVKGFGWENISILSAGLQYKGIKKLPLRVGYTYSGVPIPEEIAFFNIPATAIIKNAYQFGASYSFTDALRLDAVYHYGTGGDGISGKILNPMMASPSNPYGAIPGSDISYKMTTSMIMLGLQYSL